MRLFSTRTTWLVASAIAMLSSPLSAWAVEHGAFAQGDWPFRPLTRPVLPEVRDVSRCASPVDRFILAQLDKLSLSASETADKTTLIRRLTFDLTGVPPTPAEIDEFLGDENPDAYERLVDRLLESPRFGERWARHWLDLVRYADTGGYKWDQLRPEAYRYRDYVVDAFNSDLPYDYFVRQQIAGDELEPDNPDALIATGFIRMYPEEVSASNFVESRQHILDDITEVTGLAFMGLTLGCAKCHDHKFDPILQTDFYRLQACFAAIVPADNVPALDGEDRDSYEAKMAAWRQATREIREKMAQLTEPIRTAATSETAMAYDPETREALMLEPDKRTIRQRQLVALTDIYINRLVMRRVNRMEGEAKEDYEELQAELAKFDAMKPPMPPMAMAATDAPGVPPETCLLEAGDFRKPGRPVSPGFPEFLGASEPHIVVPEDRKESTGRRAALAQWLTRPDHPLTARIMVNRLWQHHLGVGIVSTPNDFGVVGDGAMNPDLLDWLAAELVAEDWSLKHIHRLIVTSNTYKQSSRLDAEGVHKEALAKDPGNRRLWRANRRRLEGEVVRDAMLRVSGEIVERVGGPSVKPPLPAAVVESSKYAWQPDEAKANHFRRSIYVLAQRNLRFPMFAAFDAPDAYQSCASRAKTVTAPQALTLLNGDIPQDSARAWCGSLIARAADPQAFVQAAYREAFGRAPSAEELTGAIEFLAAQADDIARSTEPGGAIAERNLPTPTTTRHPPATAAAMVDLCQALFNASEFLFVD